ncbi:GNAT family N-acetyltransferase [candidate division KSB1 bacterium]|nr:GNAT family N-acetyltransferase [candidate division KSB1 bacterium]
MSINPITVGQGTRKDIEVIAEFQIMMALETEGLRLDRVTVIRGVTTILDQPDRGFYLVARSTADQVIGSLLILKEWSDWRNADVWWIHSVYIVPESRGKGVFREMFRHVETIARRSRVKGLRLYVDKRNIHAQHVYRNLGMTNEHYEMYELMFE